MNQKFIPRKETQADNKSTHCNLFNAYRPMGRKITNKGKLQRS